MLGNRVPIRTAQMNRQFHVICTCSRRNVRHWEIASGFMRCVLRKAALITTICTDDTETAMFLCCHEGGVLALPFPSGQLPHIIRQR